MTITRTHLCLRSLSLSTEPLFIESQNDGFTIVYSIERESGEGFSIAAAEPEEVVIPPEPPRTVFSAGETKQSFARDSVEGDGDTAADSEDIGFVLAEGTNLRDPARKRRVSDVTDRFGTNESNRPEIVYGDNQSLTESFIDQETVATALGQRAGELEIESEDLEERRTSLGSIAGGSTLNQFKFCLDKRARYPPRSS